MKPIKLSITFTCLAAPLFAQEIIPCGGDFNTWKQDFAAAAINQGISAQAVNAVMDNARQSQQVLKFDRSQSTFKQTFLEFSGRTVSGSRMDIGQQKMNQYADIFARAQSDYGVPPEVITTFWAMETDFGVVQGDINTVSAIATLSHDCRRPELFQPQLIGAMKLTETGQMNPAATTGAWAGEIGQVQMLPDDILRLGIDGDNDGKVDLKNSAPDAILSGAHLLQSHGWAPNQPWIQEVTVTGDAPWAFSGLSTKKSKAEWEALGVSGRNEPLADLPANLVAPQGRFGPKFVTYPNYDVFLDWNKSFIYSLSAAYMATRLGGAPRYDKGNPEPGLSVDQTKTLQTKLQERGYDVGEVDGIVGSKTRAAVQDIQKQLGMVPDGWPTPALLNAL